MQEKTHTYTTRTITDLKPGDHLCQIYETEEEHRNLLTPYLIQGLRNNEKVFYIVDTHTAEVILEYLNSEGFNPNPYLDSGQFSIITRNEAYVKEGNFDPDHMIELLRSETEKAIKEGYGALRVTGEMTWALRGLPGSEKLIEYEAKLNDFFPGSKALAICQYDRNQFSPEILLNILKTHPIAVIGTEICDNPFYVPAKAFLGPNVYEATLDSWTNNLLERKKVESELWRSENKYRTLVDHIPKKIFIKDINSIYISCNENYARDLKIKPDEIVGKTDYDFFPKELAGKYRADDKRIIETGATEDIEERYIQDGKETWVHTVKNPLKDENGNVIGVLGIFRDISERKSAEEMLRESEEKYRTVVEGALDGVCMIGVDYRFKYVNEKLAEIQGYSREELIGTDLRDYLDEESRTLLADRAAQRKEGIKLSAYFQLNIIHKDGEVKSAEISARNIKDSKGDVNTIVILKDISERKKAEKELKASKANFLNIVENSIDGVLVVDQQGRIHYVNPVAESLLLGKKGELWGETFGFPLVAAEMVEIDIFHKNAGKGVAEMRLREIEWERKPAYLVSIRDVTETKEAEQLKVAMGERRRIDKVKDEFISNVSHELRTPLTTIKEFTSIISDEIPGKLTKEQKEYLDIIRGNVDRLARLINDILDITKIESGRIELIRAVLDINKLLEDVISTLRPEADKKHIALKNLSHTPLADVYIDPDKMVQVFTNLIENAIKFTPENGEITVEIKDKKKHIECSIADTGRGISPGNLKKLFTRFQQFDRIHGPGAKGTGLGLAITKELIKLHNGTIWAKSKLDKGTKFIFTIPRETELSYLKEILSSKIDRIASSGETLALLFIDIVNFNKLKEKWDQDSLVGLLATIKNITSSTLRKAEDVIFLLQHKRTAVIFTVKHMNDTKAVMDRLKSALQVRLFLKKDLEAAVTICMSAAIYGEHIDSVDKMIEGTSKIYDNIPISLIGRREVVVVDDDEAILEVVKTYLEKTGDFRVYAYSKAVEALEQIILIRPEIVIMDIKMPQMSGYELVGRLYSHEGFEEIPVIFISGYDFDDKQLGNIESKRVAMLKKPFSFAELLDKTNSFSIPDFRGLTAEDGKVK